MNVLSSLNSKQKQAVTALKGPVLVIAGPGSGKTRCLTHRIAYLVTKKKIPAFNILAVTFTNKAAQEMKERLAKILPPSFQRMPDIGTFHAICLRILRQDIDKLPQTSLGRNFVIYDEADRLSLIKKIINDLAVNTDQFKPSTLQNTISRAKDELIDPGSYQEQAKEYFPKTVAQVYQAYQEALAQANALDFDDLIMLTVKLFQTRPDVLKKYQNRWRYFLVDEAHDTNLSQYKLTNLLARKRQNLWLIADPDQSIYMWRGADFRNILNFEKDYPKARVILLEENYRSTKNILEAGHCVINKNTQRREKNLWTKNGQGAPINLILASNERAEGDFIVNEIEGLINEKGYTLKDFTVLYRTNAQSRAIEEAFLQAGFPYRIIGTVKFYERKEIKDILCYLRLTANPQDLVSLQRVVNLPPRRLARYSKDPSLVLRKNDKALESFNQIMNSFRIFSRQNSLTALIKKIIEEIGYEKYIKSFASDAEEGERRWENVEEIFTVASRYDKEDPGTGLEKFLEEISLLTGQDEIETNSEVINLMTLHCAKGLEFPVVFIAGCEESILPHSRSQLHRDQMEEERRLCYVGITRAKEISYLTFTNQRRLWGQTMANYPSRFLSDLPEHLIAFRQF